VKNAEWQVAVDALTAHFRDGRLVAGFVAAIERCGAATRRRMEPATNSRIASM
jgi:uncharacterized membrane protein